MKDMTRQRLIEIVGTEHVVWQAAPKGELEKTLVPAACLPPGSPDYFVYPSTAEEVRAIVGVANDLGVPIWPCGKGNNWGYGTMSTTFEGGIVLNLERMNEIHHVDGDLAFAVIGPGVTYEQLNRHLNDNGIDLIIDCNDSSPQCSVLGNALERGIGLTPYADHFSNLCGLEVVLPSGELVATGGGPINNHKNFHTYKWGTGPYLEGIFSQGNFGVVVRAGIWLMPKPEQHCSFLLELEDDESYCRSMADIRRLVLEDVIKSRIHLVNEFAALSLLSQYPRDAVVDGSHLTAESIAPLREQHGLPKWSMFGGLYGTREQVSLSRKILKKRLGKHGKVTFVGERQVKVLERLLQLRERGGVFRASADRLIKAVSGKSATMAEVFKHSFGLLTGNPTEYFVRHAYMKTSVKTPDSDVQPARDGCGCVWVAPLVPNTPEDVRIITNECERLFNAHGFELYVAQLICPRSSIYLLSIFYDKEDAEETARALSLYEEACALTLRLGYQQYRTGTHHMDKILRANPPWMDFITRLKTGVDPNNIMAPGKYGIHSTGVGDIEADRPGRSDSGSGPRRGRSVRHAPQG